jgi:hypothetical protein
METKTTGDGDMTSASQHWHVGPNIKGLYAEAHRFRDIVLRRLAGIGCEINEESLPQAQAIVSAYIGELVATPEYETLLDRPGGENRIFAILLQSCAAEVDAKITPAADKRRRPRAWHDDPVPRKVSPLRLVAENGELL